MKRLRFFGGESKRKELNDHEQVVKQQEKRLARIQHLRREREIYRRRGVVE